MTHTNATILYLFRRHADRVLSILPILFLALILFPVTTIAGSIELPQTGQTTCYGTNGNVIPCAGTGQDGDTRAGVPWPSPRFTDHGDGTVTDNLTGLMWTKDAKFLGASVGWSWALKYIADMNAGSRPNLGYTDWRLPNIRELESLSDWERSSPSLPLDHPFTNIQTVTWSSTTVAYSNNPQFAWLYNTSRGSLWHFYKDFNLGGYPVYYPFWPVRGISNLGKTGQTTSYAAGDDGDLEKGVSWPSPRFIDFGDGRVGDNLTRLMWTKDANLMANRDPGFDSEQYWPGDGFVTWQKSLDYIKKLNNEAYLGYTDWRLPNIKELFSLSDLGRSYPALPQDHPFINIKNTYWPSTTDPLYPSRTFFLDTVLGDITGAQLKTDKAWAWAVRSGRSLFGQVTENGVGIGGATLTLSGAASSTTTSAPDGTYRFDWLGNGSYTVTPSMDGYIFTPSNMAVTVSGGDVADLDFTAAPANQAPVLDPIGTKIADEGSLLSFQVSGDDPDGDTLTFDATGLPAGASFNPATQTFSWTPDYSQAGLYSVTFTVSDGSLTDSEVVAITVNHVNRPPVLDPIGPKTVSEGSTLTFSASGGDPDGDILTFNTTGLPSGASFNSETRTFSYIPGYDVSTRLVDSFFDVFFTATDGSLTVSETVRITIHNVNRPPVANAGADQQMECAGSACAVTLNGAGSSDPDSTPGTKDDIAQYRWYEGQQLIGTGENPASVLYVGVHTITLEVTDHSGATGTDTVIIAINPAPLSMLIIDKAEIDWPKSPGMLAFLQIHGRLALPAGVLLQEVAPAARTVFDLAGRSGIFSQITNFVITGDKGMNWEYKANPTGAGVQTFLIYWKGAASFNYQGPVDLKTEFIGLTETALSLNRKGTTDPISLSVNGVTAYIDESGVVTSSVPYEIDEDKEVTFRLPFELTPEMEITLAVGTQPSVTIQVGAYYTPGGGNFELRAKVNPDNLTGNSRPGTLGLNLALGNEGFPGSSVVSESQWDYMSAQEWKGDLTK